MVRRFAAGGVAGAVVFLVVGVVPAVPQEKPLRIGVLAPGPRNPPVWHCGPRDPRHGLPEARGKSLPPYIQGLREELEKLGYVEERPETRGKPGRRFVMEIVEGESKDAHRLAQDLAAKRLDLLVAISSSFVRAAQEATRANPIPILFPDISDPVSDGFAESLARPGGFITGISHKMVQVSKKRVEYFKEMLPGLRRVLTISKANYPPAQRSMSEMREAAADLRVVLLERHANSRAELQAVLTEARRGAVDGIIIPPDPVVISNADLVLTASLEQRVPAFGPLDLLAEWGALGTYGPRHNLAGQRLARYVDKIAKGAKPGDLPVDNVDPGLVLNLKTAECMGVSLPPTLLHHAERVIR